MQQSSRSTKCGPSIPEDVAGMAIAMQAQQREIVLEAGADLREQLLDQGPVGLREIGRDEAALQHERARARRRSSRRRAGAVHEKARVAPTAWIRPRKRPIHVERLLGFEIRARVRAASGTPRSGSRCARAACAPACASGATTGISACASSCAKPCSSRICSFGPALRAVELHHHRHGLLDADLIDAILEAVQRQQAAVAAQPGALDCVENHIGGEPVVRVCVRSCARRSRMGRSGRA